MASGIAEGLIDRLRETVGRRHVLTDPRRTRPFRRGFRCGEGAAAAVVLPGSLVELWRVAQACVDAGAAMIVQAANTGLTGGSTPDGDDYGRPLVLVSVRRLTGIHMLGGGRQVLCLPGATLDSLERRLAPLGREPHSVIGSSCIGASVIGGVCNNSGGALVRRGPAYTELALYGAVDERGALRLVNELGIALPGDPETVLARIEQGDLAAADIAWDDGRRASDSGYAAHVRDVDAPSAARFNADSRCLHAASGCAGRLLVFAVRLDTFAKDPDTRVFYIGTNAPEALTLLRRAILTRSAQLPIAGEYLHRTAFDIAARYGKDMFLALRHLGTERLPQLYAAKSRVDRVLGEGASDRVAQWISACLPSHLPKRMTEYRDLFEHHLLLKVSGSDANETAAILDEQREGGAIDYFACTAEEGGAAFLHRFAAAGAAVRYRAIHAREVEDIVALDIALPRNALDWPTQLPAKLAGQVVHALHYGHFFCHVFHQDYLVASGNDPKAVKAELLRALDQRGAQYPAEHGFGHLYAAPQALAEHYRTLDPTNTLNPGIGRTSKHAGWR